MAPSNVEVVREAWAAVGRGDLKTLESVFSADVRWHGLDDPESGCHSREQAIAYVERALANGVTAEAIDVREASGERVVVTVQLHQPSEWGDEPQPHGELVTVRDGEIAEIIVYASIADALRAVGANPPGPVG